MIKHYSVFADYHQFYLWDQGASPDAPTDYTDLDCTRRVKAAPFIVVIQPERNMTVSVEIEIAKEAPVLLPEKWDHVAEVSLDLPSGQLEIHECTGGSIDILSIPPDIYRVRVYFGGLNSLSDDGFDGGDHYRIVLWPAPFDDIAVLKQYLDVRSDA